MLTLGDNGNTPSVIVLVPVKMTRLFFLCHQNNRKSLNYVQSYTFNWNRKGVFVHSDV